MNVLLGEGSWHSGEQNMHRLLGVPTRENPTNYFLPPGVSRFLSVSSLLAIGTTAPDGQPWTSLLTGVPGFAGGVGPKVIGVQTTVPAGDPILQNLDDDVWEKGNTQPNGNGLMGGLAVNLEYRQRVKLFGRAGTGRRRVERSEGKGTVGFLMEIEQVLGNCPKYMNARHLETVPVEIPASVNATSYDAVPASLPQDALDLISRSDMFFVSSRNGFTDMDTNHRGGPPGFVRVLPASTSSSGSQSPSINEGTELVWPEYSGNQLYQTLGNFQVTPLAGVTFPDFNTGDVLYLTGKVEILIGDEAESVLNRSKLAVKFTVTEARFSKGALGLRLSPDDKVGWSPYNPPVRYLATETHGKKIFNSQNPSVTARLLKKEKLTDDIARFTFELSDKSTKWKAGQYVMLNFEDELSAGYRHMDDSDPQGLNDDYIRSFTVSSAPDAKNGVANGKFEITIRRKGPVTRYLFQQNPGAFFEVPLQGIGGEFFIDKCSPGKVGLVAAGVGITPFMAQWKEIKEAGLDVRLFWTVKHDDLALVKDLLETEGMEDMAGALRLFVTGQNGQENAELDANRIEYRRMKKEDLLENGDDERKWYLCTGETMQKELLHWLEEKSVNWEDFTY